MKYKFLILILIASYCNVATPAGIPPMAPDIYSAGPTSPVLSPTGIFASERAAYSLLEGVLLHTEAVIAATSCTQSAGVFDITLYSNGSVNDPAFNFVTVDSPASTFTLSANIYAKNAFRGQSMTISQTGTGAFKRVTLFNYSAFMSFNALGTMMVMDGNSMVQGIDGVPSAYQSKVIKDYYRATDSSTGLPYIYDWGLQSLSKSNYPIQKYWQRSKSLRDDSQVGRTVFVKDRLVGPNACRIVIDTSGYNNMDYFWQTGTLTISASPPALDYQFAF